MTLRPYIQPVLLAAAVAAAAGCAGPAAPDARPLAQSELDLFLARARDARVYGITTYPDAAGPRFDGANRLHLGQAAQREFAAPRDLPLPVVRARTATKADLQILLDTSARQNWLLLEWVPAMEYRPFAPPMGEYPDHVVSSIPGYAGAGNKFVLDLLHVEYPACYVPPARGRLGPLARTEAAGGRQAARRALAGRIHAVMGAALLRAFAYVRLDFPGRSATFSADAPYRPAAPAAVRACLPLRDWRGRFAVDGLLDDRPVTFVLDTAGDFAVSLPDASGTGGTATLALGDWELDEVEVASHAAHGLPENFPARLGLGVLARGAVTLDFRNRCVWFEGKPLPGTEKSATTPGDDTPVQYRGITR